MVLPFIGSSLSQLLGFLTNFSRKSDYLLDSRCLYGWCRDPRNSVLTKDKLWSYLRKGDKSCQFYKYEGAIDHLFLKCFIAKADLKYFKMCLKSSTQYFIIFLSFEKSQRSWCTHVHTEYLKHENKNTTCTCRKYERSDGRRREDAMSRYGNRQGDAGGTRINERRNMSYTGAQRDRK